jgi:ribonuclease HI
MLRWPEGLDRLRSYLERNGVDTGALRSDKQLAFLAQNLLGTRYKFPPLGQSFFPFFQTLEKHIPVIAHPHAPGKPTTARQSDMFGKDGGRRQPEPFDWSLVSRGVHVFCDGACEPNPGAGGWGFGAYIDGVESFYSHGGNVQTTNNLMELTGMLRAIEWVLEHAEGTPATIWCDSRYTVDGCNSWRWKWKARGWRRGKNAIANLGLWKTIDEALVGRPDITVAWCKAHIGIMGNERADELSLIGRRSALDQAQQNEVRKVGA